MVEGEDGVRHTQYMVYRIHVILRKWLITLLFI